MSTSTKSNTRKKATGTAAGKSSTTKTTKSSAAKASAAAESPSSTKEDTRYFNEFGSGLAYVNGISEFQDNDKTRTHLHLSVIQGPENNVHYEYHRLLVVSDCPYEAIMEHREAIETKGTRVLIRFNMVNPRVEKFIKRSGDVAGEFGTCIGGILTMKIDGELVFEDTRTFDNDDAKDQADTDTSMDDDIPF